MGNLIPDPTGQGFRPEATWNTPAAVSKQLLAGETILGYILRQGDIWRLATVNRARSVRLWPYAAAIGILAVSVATLIVFERQAVSDLCSWAIGFVEANWRRALGPGGQMIMFTVALLVLELFFLSWEKTTVFLVFVQRKMTALSDFGL